MRAPVQNTTHQSHERGGAESADNARSVHADQSENLGVEYGSNVFPRRPRNLRGDSRNNHAKPEAFSISQDTWLQTASEAFREHVGDDAHAAKRLGRVLECSPRTAENLLLGRTAPSGIHFLRAYAAIPEFSAAVRRLTAMEQTMDPVFERDLADFLTRASAHLEKRSGG